MTDRKEELISDLYKKLMELPPSSWDEEVKDLSVACSRRRYTSFVGDHYIVRLTQDRYYNRHTSDGFQTPVLEVFEGHPPDPSIRVFTLERDTLVPLFDAVSDRYQRYQESNEQRATQDQELALLEDLVKKL